MNQSILRATAVAALALTAAAAHADTKMAGTKLSEAQMMEACVQKYIADNLNDYQGKVTVNTHTAGYHPVVLNTRTQVKVSAVHRTTGQHLGTVTCDVARDGTVSVSAPTSVAAAKLEKLMKAPVVARNTAP